MALSNMPSLDDLQKVGQQALQADDFEKAIACFEQLLEQQPEVVQHRLSLGLAYLLVGQEEAAQLTWALAFSEVDEADGESLLESLAQLIQTKIQDLEQQERWALADLLYQHLYELKSLSINQTLHSIKIAIKCKLLSRERLETSGLLEALAETPQDSESIKLELLDETLQEIILWSDGDLELLSWVEKAANYLANKENVAFQLYEKSIQLRVHYHSGKDPAVALAYTEAALRLNETDFDLKYDRVLIHLKNGNYKEAILLAENLLLECEDTQQKIHTKSLLIELFVHVPGKWNSAYQQLQDILRLFEDLIQEYDRKPDFYIPSSLLTRPLFLYQYLKDDPVEERTLQNQLSSICMHSLQKQASKNFEGFTGYTSPRKHDIKAPEKLRIGFLSECMRRHSVGWLSRWIFQHYDREKFEFNVYFQNHSSPSLEISPFSQKWFADAATKASVVYGHHEVVAEQLEKENIDILIDLDSLTCDRNYSILALKPAPVQVTWLGFDATGLPAVDYFLADPFVLPDDADSYYAETIWRMPKTYIAVDGFEVGIPSLRRDKLDIPTDAVVYFSAQTAAKRHPDTVRCQMEILKQVPNSYLLLKGSGDAASLRNSFLQMAEEVGVESDRLKFLGPVSYEAIHRANIGIADVVLDTFPYTGATTTIETLWMGVPLVTHVGQQFTSRNSYAMLRQVGVEAGIAHSAEEYVEWGVRLGTDAALRNQVKHQLWRSRQTSPLWNAKQFTRDLEHAFEQMWQRYLDSSSKFV